MKKLLLSLVLVLATLSAQAMDVADSMKELEIMAAGDPGLVLITLTKDKAKAKKMSDFIAAFEAKHAKDSVSIHFIMASRKNKDIEGLAKKIQVVDDPITLIIFNHRGLGRVTGLPESLDQMESVLLPVQNAILNAKKAADKADESAPAPTK